MSVHHVLVVEDHPDSAEVLATFLRSLGHEASIANDGESALELCTRLRPTFAIIDIGLSTMDGFTLARHLRKRFGRELPIVALSAYSTLDYRKRAREAGIDAYLTKPVDWLEVEAVLAGRYS